MRIFASTSSRPRARGSLSTLLFLGGALSAGCGGPDPLTEEQTCPSEQCTPASQPQGIIGPRDYTVLQYNLRMDLTSAKFGQASSELVVAPTKTIDCLSIPGPQGEQNLDWFYQGQSVLAGSNWGDQHLNLCSKDGVEANRAPSFVKGTYTIPQVTYDYSQVGFSTRRDATGGNFTYLLGWVESCDLFGPCDDEVGQQTRVSFTVDHPAGQLVLCPGTRTPLRNDSTNTQTKCDLPANTKAPTYSSFAVATNPSWVETQWLTSPVSVKFYEGPSSPLRSALNSSDFASFLNWITHTDRLGPLPYGQELRIASGPTDWLGMEHPANIILREDLPQLRRDYANMTLHTLMHEVVHQWAGNRTTMSSKWDFAWKEALAEYMTYLYEEQYRSNEVSQTRVYWDRQARTASYFLQPQDEPLPPYISFVNDVYGSGPMILFLQLEPLISKEKVLAGIKSFLSSSAPTRSIDDLRTAMENASGKNLGPYFDAWVKRSGEPVWPFYEYVDSSSSRKNRMLSFKVAQRSEVYFPGYVEVDVSFHETTEKRPGVAKFELDGQNKEVTVEVQMGSSNWTPSGFAIDPRNKFVNRTSNGFAPEPKVARWRL